MARSKPRGASGPAKPIKGKRPITPHDGSVVQAGGAMKSGRGATSNARVSEGNLGAAGMGTGRGRRGC